MARPDPESIADMMGPPEDSEGAGDDDKEAAAKDLLAAIEAKDPKALAEAFEALCQLCMPGA